MPQDIQLRIKLKGDFLGPLPCFLSCKKRLRDLFKQALKSRALAVGYIDLQELFRIELLRAVGIFPSEAIEVKLSVKFSENGIGARNQQCSETTVGIRAY